MMIGVDAAVDVLRGDLSREWADACTKAGRVAWDIETSGLDWRTDRIGTCQIATDDRVAIVILGDRRIPTRLAGLLEQSDVQKVFHHAPFDLRFMTHAWRAVPQNVACTKVASKILRPDLDNREHSLMPVLGRYLNIHISKEQQVSDWLSPTLTDEQLQYAATDVAHLLQLLDTLTTACKAKGLARLLAASFDYLPVRVQLDLRGSGDVFAY